MTMTDPKTPWGGRFTDATDDFAIRFGASLPFDRRLWAQDIEGSIAHARMLAEVGLLGADDADAIESGLRSIGEEISAGRFEWRVQDEDVHMAIERVLTERIGDAGKRLHTARSRNDQVATDTRLWVMAAASGLLARVDSLRGTVLEVAERHVATIMPGYTHLQRAQPVSFAHHLLAYFWMLSRDADRMAAAHAAADSLPLGSAALAGTPHPVDRASVAEKLGFSSVIPNSMDAVSDRDFLLDLVYACSMIAMHLSRLAEEIVLWSSEEFGFVSLDDSWSTGSSIMPQKRNPDFAELVRGKTGRVYGGLVSLLTTMKGLPLAYNKDMQEDKEPAFDAVDTVGDCLLAIEGMLANMTVREDRMLAAAEQGFMAATDLADHLAASGVPFREAHEIVGRLVLECERTGRGMGDLTAADLEAADPRFGGAVIALGAAEVAARRRGAGGTGPGAVEAQIVQARALLEDGRRR